MVDPDFVSPVVDFLVAKSLTRIDQYRLKGEKIIAFSFCKSAQVDAEFVFILVGVDILVIFQLNLGSEMKSWVFTVPVSAAMVAITHNFFIFANFESQTLSSTARSM